MIDFLFTRTPLVYLVQGLWRDEAFSYLLSKRSFSEIIAITSQDFNPPLYYFLLHIWMSLFGSSEVSLRSLSLVFFTIGTFAVYETIKLVFKTTHKEALAYIAIFVLNPLVLYYAFEARMYSMMFCFAMISNFFLLKRKYGAYAIITVIGLYTHYFMLLLVGAQIIWLLFQDRNEKRHLAYFFHHMRVPLLCLAAFAPWFIYFALRNTMVGGEFWIKQLKLSEILIMPALIYSGIDRDFWAPIVGNQMLVDVLNNFSLLFWFTAAVGYLQLKKDKAAMHVYYLLLACVLIPLLAIVIVSPLKPIFLPRYLIISAAAVSLLMIFVISKLGRFWKGMLLAFMLFLTFQFQAIQMEYRTRSNIKATSEQIKQLIRPGDVVYVTSELDFMVAQYYLGEDKVFIYQKPYDEIPHYVGKVIIPPSAVVSSLPPFPAKAFILTSENTFIVKSDFGL